MPLPKRVILGSLIVIGGTFAWIMVAFLPNAWSEGWLPRMPLIAGYAVLLASWFLLPLGAAIGASMPVIIRDRSAMSASLRGMGVGALVGIIVATITVFLEHFVTVSGPAEVLRLGIWDRTLLDRYFFYCFTMIIVCAPSVAIWAYLWRRHWRT